MGIIAIESTLCARAVTWRGGDAQRARIIVACAEGHGAEEVATASGVHSRRVERWRARFLKSRLEGFEDQPRPGRKPKFGAVARCEIIAVACEPIVAVKGMTRTIEDVVLEVINRGIVDDIGWTSVQRTLASGDVHPHKVEGWLHGPDPLFREKVTEIV